MSIIIVCGGGNLDNNLGGNFIATRFLVGCAALTTMATLATTFLASRHSHVWGWCVFGAL